MGAVGTQTTYVLDAPAGNTITTRLGREIAVAYVEWRTYVYEGEAYRIVIAFAENHENRSWYVDGDQIPAWIPEPPKAWLDLADEIAAQAVTS